MIPFKFAWPLDAHISAPALAARSLDSGKEVNARPTLPYPMRAIRKRLFYKVFWPPMNADERR
jgi:hypothetical protein